MDVRIYDPTIDWGRVNDTEKQQKLFNRLESAVQIIKRGGQCPDDKFICEGCCLNKSLKCIRGATMKLAVYNYLSNSIKLGIKLGDI